MGIMSTVVTGFKQSDLYCNSHTHFLCSPVVFKGLKLAFLKVFFLCYNKQDALPLIHKLSYTQEYDKAMQHVFGRTLLCRNMEAAFHFSDENDLDCITLDGDQVSILKSVIYIE